MPAKLTKEEAHAFLDSRPGWLVLTSIGPTGYPHSVPVGYFRAGDEVYTGGRAGTQRLKNIQRNPKVSALIESGHTMQDIKGLMLQGNADVVTDTDEVLRLTREAARWRGTPEDQLPTEPRPGVAYIRIHPRRYVSWDYSREG
jgi:nitroimidazol reductase NimA-like FMN-containing flavoprotein (pyridoxamine 5'-phosphate oxidase superfamily)